MKIIKSILKSFLCAIRGLLTAVKTERSLRIELAAIVYVSVFSLIYGLSGVEKAVLMLTFCIVPALELVNTAIENAVNLKTQEQNPIARTAKDIAAAAVLFSAVTAAVVAFCLFSDSEKLSYAFRTVISPPWIIILAVSLIPAVLFIRLPVGRDEKERKKTDRTQK